ncbi:MAG: tetratricopeptide repeat protein [Burkholderiaceae bacterium]
MTSSTLAAPYTLRSIEQMLGLGRSVIAAMISAGFVSPSRGVRNEYRFTFQDVVLLRTAHHLRSANIPPRRVLTSLQKLRANLPAEIPLTGLRIRAVGKDVAVRNADAQWEAANGQLLMDFEVASAAGAVSFLEHAPAALAAPAVAMRTADDCFVEAEKLELTDRQAAEAAYREALTMAPDHSRAALNLGALLCDAGRFAEAVALYDLAIESDKTDALLFFNRAIALEDLHRDQEALKSYERCLQLAPELADAHYNAARIHERLGHAQSAVRHYSAYRRFQRDP